ncbi:TPA: hypothetical protein ACS727_003798 [Providencia alcalifaciens]|uniref:Uncharacterized protein n=2 Tax=Providencia alcalifaciens TaxID=126385 RepID=B6XBH0_9GAMM|nr:hypothetical protein [Providencia alcalifaciens]ATG16312.1 hypothetical protein CO695_08400 [Providencia alcalifaciens]EEB47265.1 hypothetical protein PROVALCAL_00679 [Providencia alcalifaciens DSM 30120]EUD10077.1 hypothetical protein HMPREF1563_2581 [Providencia alcalifaciens 205/92]MTC16302.1 hypothetical protein [Providencia alcalifaciens]MTC25672.1 hypothetical protein [Providencia alcalifaciens]
MTRDEYVYVLSERSQVMSMLKSIDEKNVISRMSLEYRLSQLDDEIKNANINMHSPAKAVITFKGDPVLGTVGISSAFGAKILKAFNSAITHMSTSLMPVTAVQKIEPMIITGTAKGSFGFVLEEPSREGVLDFDEKSITSCSLEKTYKILSSAINGDDELLANELEAIDENSIKKIREFIDILVKEKTIFTIKNSDFSLVVRNPQQLETISYKLSVDNIKEEIKTLDVTFTGVLPNKRRCEFKLFSDDIDVEVATISPHIKSPEVINTLIGKTVQAKFLCTTVGNGKTKYSLRDLP